MMIENYNNVEPLAFDFTNWRITPDTLSSDPHIESSSSVFVQMEIFGFFSRGGVAGTSFLTT